MTLAPSGRLNSRHQRRTGDGGTGDPRVTGAIVRRQLWPPATLARRPRRRPNLHDPRSSRNRHRRQWPTCCRRRRRSGSAWAARPSMTIPALRGTPVPSPQGHTAAPPDQRILLTCSRRRFRAAMLADISVRSSRRPPRTYWDGKSLAVRGLVQAVRRPITIGRAAVVAQ
jgi:hypothetical protein